MEAKHNPLFEQARQRGLTQPTPELGIGTLGEKRLPAILKLFYQPDASLHERKIGRMTADAILNDGSILEIQTGSFSSLRKKLPVFLACGPVHLVAPVIAEKWVCWVSPETGEILSRRRSPKRYAPIDLARELNTIREFLSHPDLTVHFPFLTAKEYRLLDGWGNGGKRGSSRYERIPLALLSNLPERFTTKELQHSARISSRCAYAAAALFRSLDIIEEAGTQGRARLYQLKKQNN